MSRIRILLAICGVMALAVSVCGQPQPGSPWPMLHGDQYHTGRSPYSGPETSALKWVFETPGNRSSPAISADGTIYLAASDEYVYAIDPDGTEKWRFLRSGAGLVSSSPAIGADGTIYVGDDGAFFYAINPDGSQKWKYEMGSLSRPRPSPTIGEDGTIYIGTIRSGTLYALNPDGTANWTYCVGDWKVLYDAPSIDPDGNIYIQSDDGYLYAFSFKGSLLWQYYVGFSGGDYRGSTSFSVADSTVYTGSLRDTLYALSTDGTLKWTFGTGGQITAAPVIGDDGTIYFGSDQFYALDPDGSLKWNFPTPAPVYTSAAIDSDGTIYFGTLGADTTTNRVYALNPDGSLLWNSSVSYRVVTCPAIGSDGTMYIGTDDGKLYAFGTPTGAEEREHLRAFRNELRQNRPNPFVASGKGTVISYGVARAGDVSLSVYDVSGRLVQTLVHGKKKAGRYSITWEGTDTLGKKVAGGVYFCKMRAGSFADVKKMVLLR